MSPFKDKTCRDTSGTGTSKTCKSYRQQEKLRCLILSKTGGADDFLCGVTNRRLTGNNIMTDVLLREFNDPPKSHNVL